MLVYIDDDRGDHAGLDGSLVSREGFFREISLLKPAVSQERMIYLQCDADAMQAELALTRDDRINSIKRARAGLAALDAFHFSQPHSSAEESCRYKLTFVLARAQDASNDSVASEASLHSSIKAHDAMSSHTPEDVRIAAVLSTWLALAQTGQGRSEDARATLTPVLVLQRALSIQGNEGAQQHLELAMALYVQALTLAGAPRHALLAEAAALVGRLPAPMRTLHSVQSWQGRISAARSGKDLPPSIAAAAS